MKEYNNNAHWRIFIAEIVEKMEAIKLWQGNEKVPLLRKGEILHDLEMEISGLLGFGSKMWGHKREYIREFAERTAPYNPACEEGLKELRKLGIVGWA